MKRPAIALLFFILATGCFAQTAGKPSGVELTVYNDNFALVKENRMMTLGAGVNTVAVEDVAATIEPNSVAF